MTDDLDIFDDVPEMPTETGLSRMSKLYQRWKKLQEREAVLLAEVALVTEERLKLEEVEFPELFDEVGVSEITIGDSRLLVSEKLYGSLPKDPAEREVALNEVETHGGLGILQTAVNVTFPKSEAEEAREFAAGLKEDGYTFEMKEDINHMTYKAWAKEQMEKGTPLDLKALGIWSRRFVEEKKPRGKKK